jgi:hypothetical protein
MILAALLALAVVAATSVSIPGRDGYFWRLESEGSNVSDWSDGPDNTSHEDITYYYNPSFPSRLDSMYVAYYNDYGGGSVWSYFTRTDQADGYVITENRYTYWDGAGPYYHRFKKTYNLQDQLLLSQNYDSTMELTDHDEYTYDAQGNQIHFKHYSWQSYGYRLSSEELRSYNDHGLLTWLQRQTLHWQTHEMVTTMEEEHFYSVFPSPDSSVVYLHAIGDDSSPQSLIDRQYNEFDSHGNIVHSLNKLYPDPDNGNSSDYWERNTYTQYTPGLQGWLPAHVLTYGTFYDFGWTISCYSDSTLATYAYSADFLQEDYNWQSFIRDGQGNRTICYNEAGLMASRSGYEDFYTYGSSFSYNWDWAYVNSEVVVPPIPPVPASLSCAPNPFRESIGLKLTSEAGPATAAVYNLRGQRVRDLGQWDMGGVDYFLSWDGKDDSGRKLASGVYVIRAETASGSAQARVSLVH